MRTISVRTTCTCLDHFVLSFASLHTVQVSPGQVVQQATIGLQLLLAVLAGEVVGEDHVAPDLVDGLRILAKGVLTVDLQTYVSRT